MVQQYPTTAFRLRRDIGDSAKGYFQQSLECFGDRLPDEQPFGMVGEVDGDRLVLVAELPAPVGRIEFVVQKGYWFWAKDVSVSRQG